MFIDTIDSLAALLGNRQVAADLLAKYSLQGLRDITANELQQVQGLGTRRATRLLASADLARRWSKITSPDRFLVDSPAAAYDILGPRLGNQQREHFYALLLNTKNRLIAQELVSIGHLNASLVHPREVFKAAIRNSAAGLIVAHNHPSSDTTPSTEDLSLTARLIEAGRLVGIPVLDHIIIGQGHYKSLRESSGLWDAGQRRVEGLVANERR